MLHCGRLFTYSEFEGLFACSGRLDAGFAPGR
jgi:hypothetical protein